MILLERLAVREFGALRHVDMAFDPTGHQLVTLGPDESRLLRLALTTCLFGAPEGLRARYDGASTECTIVVNGRPLTIRRTLQATSRDKTELVFQQAGYMREIHGEAQVRESIDSAIGLDQENLEFLTVPQPRSELPPPTQIRSLARHLLGERRIGELEAHFADQPELQEEETVARARLELAQTAARADDNEAEVDRLERLLHQWRISQTLRSFEAATDRLLQARDSGQEHCDSRSRFIGEQEAWRSRWRLASLWTDRKRRSMEATELAGEVKRLETSLAEIGPLAQQARTAAERFGTLERSCDAFAASESAASAADRARAHREACRQAVRELLKARADLAETTTSCAELQATAERAKTMLGRSQENDNLPAAHRLWGEASEILAAEETEGQDRTDIASLEHEITRITQRMRVIQLAAKRRRTNILISGAGAALGLALTLIGVVGATPIAWLGITVGLAGTVVGLWSVWSEKAEQTHTASLRDRLIVLDGERQTTRELSPNLEQNGERRARIEHELERLGLEVPKSRQRAQLLRDSATARLRRLADGDITASSQTLGSENERASRELAQATREVRRLNARVTALEASGPEGLATAADTELRHQIEASGRSRSRASALARSLGFADDHEAVAAAREAQRRELKALEARLDSSTNLDESRRRAQQRQQSADEALPGIEQQIRSLLRTNPDLPRFEPTANAGQRLVGLAALGGVLAAVGEARAASQEGEAADAERTAQDSVTRTSTELASAVQATGVQIDRTPTAAEVRAIFPNVDEDPVADSSRARASLQRARAARREFNDRLHRLELRAGVVRDEVNLTKAIASLDQIVDERDVRASASRMISEAIDALTAGVPAATEATLRQIIGRITGGLHWDVRISPDMTVHVWDDERDSWTQLPDLPATVGAPVKLAVSAALMASVRPHDATQAPAFMWLQVVDDGSESSPTEALLDAMTRTDLRAQFPQVIVTAPPGKLTRTGFSRVTPIVNGMSEQPLDNSTTAKWLSTVG
jgi:hypothetical protein